MKKFYNKIDLSKECMIDYLSDHFRYNTMNSWNRSTSYANNVKIYKLELSEDMENKLYNYIDAIDEIIDYKVSSAIRNFEQEHGNAYTAAFNGGYLVLYEMELKLSDYKSYCTECGQKNYTSIKEKGNTCGRCKKNARIDYETPLLDRCVWLGRSIDQNEDFSEWDLYNLKERTKLVQSFDKLTDTIVKLYTDFAEDISKNDFNIDTNEGEVI